MKPFLIFAALVAAFVVGAMVGAALTSVVGGWWVGDLIDFFG